MSVLAVVSTVVLCAVITGLLIRYAPSLGLVDVPNHRSAHSMPTPRAGGMAIMLSWLIALFFAGAFSTDQSTVLMILTLTAATALLGLGDDFLSLSAKLRLMVQLAIAIVFLIMIGGWPTLNVLGHPIQGGMIGLPLAIISIIWITNLFNFMDGINGISGLQALFFSWALAYHLNNTIPDSTLIPVLLMLGAACIGFLFWNFLGKIFMGDMGSAAIGTFIAATSVYLGFLDQRLFWVTFVLMAAFYSDATFTLIARALNRENLLQAHNTHIFQKLTRKLQSHTIVTLLFLGFNMIVLLPASMMIMRGTDGFVVTVLVYLGIFLLWRTMRHTLRDI